MQAGGRSEGGNAGRTSGVPVVSLPKGGGAIRGLGEKFAANPVTGTGSASVPIVTSPGRSGLGPELSLSYDSGHGNGSFGFGWSMALPSITRKTATGLPRYRDAEESDVFLLSGAEDLVPVVGADGARFEDTEREPGWTIHRYRPRIEGLFARIERWTREDGDVHWRVTSRDNVLSVYGQDAESRIADPDAPDRVFSWLLCETRDDRGNAVLYGYKAEDGAGVDLSKASERHRGPRDDRRRSANRYLKRIRYGNRVPFLDGAGRRPRRLTEAQVDGARWMFEVVLDYGEHDPDVPAPGDASEWSHRGDPFSSYSAGFEVRTTRLCRRVLAFHHFPGEPGVGADCLVRSTDFTYSHERDPADARNPVYTFLAGVTQSGYRRQGDGYLRRSLPPVEYEYTQPVVQDAVEEVDAASLENLPAGADAAQWQWVDLHGEGVAGLLAGQAGAWLYKRNLSPVDGSTVALAPVERVAATPNVAVARGDARFLDLAGDGQPDLVVLDGAVPGLYERDGGDGWQPFRPFTSLLNRRLGGGDVRFVDLDGDGRADVLVAEDGALVWHRSLGEDGFGEAERLPQAADEDDGPPLADTTGTVHLADLSGDGLTDVVRIRNGEVCYWPNLGHGRFGAKVTMDDAPWFDHPEQFDPARVRLADVDGSGTTDVLYLHRDGVRLYFNQSGNGWSAPRVLDVFPPVHDVTSVVPADLLGNGTACLVWSSPLTGDARRQMRYVDLMGGTKPHLLTTTVNNLGAVTRISYAPSTRFALRDELEGRPWLTRLPFPVHVVERVETYDHVSGSRFVTRYAYHHGHYDATEREFRGFGMVEQWDTEEISALGEGSQPPVLTRTWFHTGVHVEGADRGEYFREPGSSDAEARALLLADTEVPAGLTLDEEREACRALKGAMLRQEVYAADGSPRAALPYTVVEQRLAVRLVQPRHANRHAVLFTHAGESLTYDYERNPADPRTRHVLTMQVDGFGNVLEEAVVGYGRRRPDPALPSQPDRDRQARTLVTRTERAVTAAVDDVAARPDDYRAPLPCESRTYELTGCTPTGPAGRFGPDDLAPVGVELAYEEVPTGGRQHRLVEHVRTLYRPDDLGAAGGGPVALLPLGTAEPRALPGESFKLAFTPGLLAQAFDRDGQSLLPDPGAVLGARGPGGGGYVSDGDLVARGLVPGGGPVDRWWVPSGRVFYSPDGDDDATEELEHARRHFFLPHRHRDPFHTEASRTWSSVTYDANDLLVVETRDPVGNRVTVGERLADGRPDPAAPGNDYRVLQPWRLTDANGNRTEVAFDALGTVVGTAVAGKAGQAAGDSLDGFVADLSEAETLAHLADPLADPHALLTRATTRLLHDVHAFRRTRDQPDRHPAVVATLTREVHAADLAPGQAAPVRHSFSYSDGFGREVQHKLEAEPEAAGAGPRWVASGWTVFNNKDKPVRRYEPSFTATHRFEPRLETGVSPVLFYDPLGRVVATVYPDHSYEKVVFDAWQQATWDANDTVLDDPRTDGDVGANTGPHVAGLAAGPGGWRTWHEERAGGALGGDEQAAAAKAAAHARTPATTSFDALGRPFLTLAHNGTGPDGEPVRLATRVDLDIQGNQVAVRDAVDHAGDGHGRVVVRHVHDLLGRRARQASMDGGRRWSLADAAGEPVRTWDDLGHATRTEYDPLRRRVRSFVAGTDPADAGREVLVERVVHGEQHPAAESRNLRGRRWLHLDQAGALADEEHDFKGNPRRTTRRLALDYTAVVDWSATDVAVPADAAATVDLAALDAALAPAVEADAFTTETTYDALDRPVTTTTPHTPAMSSSIVMARYNGANLLEQVEVNLRGERDGAGARVWTPFVTGVDYGARGERRRIDYGNGVSTTYDYDPLTSRLSRLVTRRDPAAFPGDCPQPPAAGWPGCQVQDLRYTYDPVGNVCRIRDGAQQAVFFRNRRVEATNEYTYDALYRLTEVRGREHLGQAGTPAPHASEDATRVRRGPSPDDGNAMGTYLERYVYDAVGNLLEMAHVRTDAQVTGWARRYTYAEDSLIEDGAGGGPPKTGNRLSATAVGQAGTPERYAYDAHGNMARMPHLGGGHPDPNLEWDHAGRLRRADLGGGGTAWYVHGADGRRVRKVWEKSAGLVEDRVYLDGVEIFRRRSGAQRLERETLHVMDDRQRIAMVETRTADTAGTDQAPAQLVRYQLGDHLGSATLELDGEARLVSYEEYTPYGATTYQAVRNATETPKRYRYTGKERDEETGLYDHGARSYAPWLGRWTAVDPVLFDASRSGAGAVAPPGSTDSSLDPQRAVSSPPEAADEPTTVGVSQAAPRLEPYGYSYGNPVVNVDPDGGAPVKVGYIYTLRAQVDGKEVVYSGQTARELAQRLYKDKHKWADIIKAKTTTIEAHEVTAELNVGASGRGTVASARKEALSAAEQVVVKRRRAEMGAKELNAIEAAEEANILKWADRHAVRLGPRFTFRAGVKVSGVAAFAILDVFLMWRDMKMSQYVMAPYLLEDENGVFTLQEHDRGIFRSNHYFKNYKTGAKAGTSVQISEGEFYDLKEEAELLWGTTDWKGDWVPGLLRPELPVVDPSAVCASSMCA